MLFFTCLVSYLTPHAIDESRTPPHIICARFRCPLSSPSREQIGFECCKFQKITCRLEPLPTQTQRVEPLWTPLAEVHSTLDAQSHDPHHAQNTNILVVPDFRFVPFHFKRSQTNWTGRKGRRRPPARSNIFTGRFTGLLSLTLDTTASNSLSSTQAYR